MFKVLKYKKKNSLSLVSKTYYCIYNEDKVSRKTAEARIKSQTPTRNVLLVSREMYRGVIEDLVECANKNLEKEEETKDEDNS